MAERALLDTGVLVAFLHRDDQAHRASVDALAEDMGTDAVFTLDRRGFSTYRTATGRAFEIRP